MRVQDYQDKSFSDFYGLYDRGDTSQVPENHFSDCLNVDYEIGECKTRAGLSTSITLGYGAGNGKVRRFTNFITTVGVITLILDDSGNLYTFSNRTGDTATTPRLTVALATDFSAIQFLGKIFISFHDGKNGLLGVNVKVFIPAVLVGNDEFRDAAGLAPTAGSAMIAANGAAGNVGAGNYKIAVAYITTSGYVTNPGPKIASVFTPTSYTAPGTQTIDLSNIPLGPAGTAKRQIIITKPGGAEYFFITSTDGGIINDNTTTTTNLHFNSLTGLVDSADFLFDQLESIPASLGLQDYNSRLGYYGEKANPSIVRFSFPGEPESVDAIDGIVVVSKDDGFEIRNAFVGRNIFYICKDLGMYAILDNSDVPSTWPAPSAIDRSVSVPVHGVASFFSTSGVKFARGWTLFADRSGILYHDGSIRKPPITDKINGIWQRVNFEQYHKIVLAVDERAHKIYCSIPLDSSADNNIVLLGDYNLCPGKIPDATNSKWSVWKFKPGGVERGATDIGLIIVSPEMTPTLKIASVGGGGKIWKIDTSVTGQDDGSDYESFIETWELSWAEGYIHTFVGARMKIKGTGCMVPTMSGLDGVLPTDLKIFKIDDYNGKEKLVKCNFSNERAKFKFKVLVGKFTISDLMMFGKPMLSARPE